MTSLKGKILIASPQLLDPNFAQSVVLMVQHDADGALGLIINRPLETTVGEAWRQVTEVPYQNEDPLYAGGPVEGPLMVLHHDAARGQIEIADGLHLSSDAMAVKALVDEQIEPLKFLVGYAGWSADQLEGELAEGAWLVAELSIDEVLHTPADLWDKLIKRAARATRPAIDARLIPPDPSVN